MPKSGKTAPLQMTRQDRPARRLFGLGGRFTKETRHTIPALWIEFGPRIGTFEGEIAGAAYGVSYNTGEDGFDYFVGVAVEPKAVLPDGLQVLDVPGQHCAVFLHEGHISEFQGSMNAVWDWLEETREVQVQRGHEIEIYGEQFDGETGRGVVEICIPIRRA